MKGSPKNNAQIWEQGRQCNSVVQGCRSLPSKPASSIHLAYFGLLEALRQITRPPGYTQRQTQNVIQHHQSPFHHADLFIKYLTCISQGGFQVQDSMYHTFTWSFNAAHSVSMSGCSSQSTWSIRITCTGFKCKSSVHEDLTQKMHIFLNPCAFLHPLSFIILVRNRICILYGWSRSYNIQLQKAQALVVHTFVYIRFLSSSTKAVVRISRRSSIARSIYNQSQEEIPA